ncbi:MAG: glycosyltransferase [Proteobacteria bacterium]|nr:glycosyltransferase [Pseudomonadota bacterium]
MMKVLHFILGKASKDRPNGVNQVIAGLAKYSTRHGAQVRVIGKAQTVEREGQRITRDGFEVEAYSCWRGPLVKALVEAIEWADLVHLHGVYAPWNLWVSRLCRRAGRPFVITLHDGLSPERALVKGRIKKRVFHELFQKSYLQKAAAVHVLTEEEGTDLWACARPRRVFCIPNGVDLEDFPQFERRSIGDKANLVLGYLGRLSPEKNLDAFCRAFAAVNTDGCFRLQLAGPDSDYARALVRQFGAQGVEWVGPRYGEAKTAFIRSLDLFIMPSLSEGFSIAAIEVLALGTPLLITRTAKACYFYNSQAFFMCEPTTFGLERGLRMAVDRRNDWPVMATRGRTLIEDRLNWSVVARDMLSAYAECVGGDR